MSKKKVSDFVGNDSLWYRNTKYSFVNEDRRFHLFIVHFILNDAKKNNHILRKKAIVEKK